MKATRTSIPKSITSSARNTGDKPLTSTSLLLVRPVIERRVLMLVRSLAVRAVRTFFQSTHGQLVGSLYPSGSDHTPPDRNRAGDREDPGAEQSRTDRR